MTALVGLLSHVARATVIIALSIAVGLAVAFASRSVEGDVLECLALFATFAAPVSVAWLLFRTIPPVSIRATDSPIVRISENGDGAQNANGQTPEIAANRFRQAEDCLTYNEFDSQHRL